MALWVLFLSTPIAVSTSCGVGGAFKFFTYLIICCSKCVLLGDLRCEKDTFSFLSRSLRCFASSIIPPLAALIPACTHYKNTGARYPAVCPSGSHEPEYIACGSTRAGFAPQDGRGIRTARVFDCPSFLQFPQGAGRDINPFAPAPQVGAGPDSPPGSFPCLAHGSS